MTQGLWYLPDFDHYPCLTIKKWEMARLTKALASYTVGLAWRIPVRPFNMPNTDRPSKSLRHRDSEWETESKTGMKGKRDENFGSRIFMKSCLREKL